MSTRTSGELDKIAAAEELELASARHDGPAAYMDPTVIPRARAATLKLVPS